MNWLNRIRGIAYHLRSRFTKPWRHNVWWQIMERMAHDRN